jgi:hypothetical protein
MTFNLLLKDLNTKKQKKNCKLFLLNLIRSIDLLSHVLPLALGRYMYFQLIFLYVQGIPAHLNCPCLNAWF